LILSVPITMNIKEYLSYVKRKEIPPRSPAHLLNHDSWRDHNLFMQGVKARIECVNRGMWAIVDLRWTGELAEWIRKRKVLEIMAGAGWIAKALNHHGVDIIPTDDFSWSIARKKKKYKGYEPVFPIEKLDAVGAVEKYRKAEILLISWPPFNDYTIFKACGKWGDKKPIVYIGEIGGCNAPIEFFTKFERIEPHPRFSFPSWNGIYDRLLIGYYKKNRNPRKGEIGNEDQDDSKDFAS